MPPGALRFPAIGLRAAEERSVMADTGDNRRSGNVGEALACGEYLRRGYSVLERNMRVPGFGEADIVLEDTAEKLLVFCEVKLRRSSRFGSPGEAVNHKKQMTIRRLAECYLASHPEYDGYNVRFDVAEILADEKRTGRNRINMIEDAF